MAADIYYSPVGEGEPVIVFHGGPGLDHSYLLPHFDFLADTYRLIFYDQRGTGQSGGHVGIGEITLDHFVADADRLRRGLELDKVHLIGHGWGALLAAYYALAHPSEIRSLTLLHPMPFTFSSYLMATQAVMAVRSQEDQDTLSRLAASEGALLGDRQPVNEYLNQWLRAYFADATKAEQLPMFDDPTAKNAFAVFTLIMDDLGHYDLLSQLGRLTVPVLVVQGDHSPVPPSVINEIAGHLPNPRVEVIHGAGDFSFIEQPLAFQRVIKGFLSGVHHRAQ